MDTPFLFKNSYENMIFSYDRQSQWQSTVVTVRFYTDAYINLHMELPYSENTVF